MDLALADLLAPSGQGLNVEEKAALEVELSKRRLEEGFDRVFFWGRITGTDADYLVVYGLENSEEWPKKKFYFCTTKNFELQSFGELTPEFRERSAELNTRFKGDPTLLLTGEEEEEEEEPDDEEEETKKEKPPKFSEMYRLAYVVELIDRDTAVVPRDAFIVTPTHIIQRNSAFGGLSAADAEDLNSYFHFREPTNLQKKSVLEKRRLIASTEFLDPLSEDSPKGSWALRVNRATNLAVLRSLVWPGYHFTHKLGTSDFAGAYFGDGRRNSDLAFMI